MTVARPFLPLHPVVAFLTALALLTASESWAFAVDSSAERCHHVHHAARASDIRGALDYLPPPCMAAAVRPAQETSSRLLRNPGLTAWLIQSAAPYIKNRPLTRTERNGNLTAYAYDARGNLSSESRPQSVTRIFTCIRFRRTQARICRSSKGNRVP